MSGPAIRVVNYHLTPARLAEVYDREFAHLATRYAPVSEDDLAAYFATGHWPGKHPGVIPVFYNGYRNGYDVARPALDKHGLIGWFMAVTGFSSCPGPDQIDFAAAHGLATEPDEYADGRIALSWDELRALDLRHVLASHTRHYNRASTLNAGQAEAIVLRAKQDFRRELGHPVRSFAWAHGGAYGETPQADAAVDRAGHDFLFSNLRLQFLGGPGRLEPARGLGQAP